MHTVRNRRLPTRLLSLAGLFLVACTSGGDDSGGFAITSINVPKNAVWQINRPIKITFSQAVDFSTINLNTINVRRVGGGPSAGEFFVESGNVVVFQPRCPTLGDLSDAGLQPGGVTYELNVLGVGQAPLTVKSSAGTALAVGDTRTFATPTSTLPTDLFFDPKVGPPEPIVRNNDPADMAMEACYLELGGDPSQRVYFRRDGAGTGILEPLQEVPLNMLSDVASQVALMLVFNQPVDPTPVNINPLRLSWQFDAAAGGAGSPVWTPLTTDVLLVTNCTQAGALLRITPRGVLPPGTALRMVVAPEFSDIVGQTNLLAQDNFANADTDPGPSAQNPLADHFLEEYADAADLDTSGGFAEPQAFVVDGELRARFSFTGTGGPGGAFDWLIPTGQTLIFNTDSTTIVGGPNFSPSTSQTVVGGVIDVRNMRIEAGGRLKVIGPNPLKILASGTVEIEGELNINGTDSPGVTTLNTTNIPETGAPGQAGGGKGGTGSPLITASSPFGGNGFGAFNQPDAGGQGGETGWNNVANAQLNGRRGAGGGGGTFGPNQLQNFGTVATYGDYDQSYIGLDGESGFPNLEQVQSHNGAVTGPAGPLGGDVGPSPFTDTDPNNNFFGQSLDTSTNAVTLGELKKPWAGAGGGGGGDASFVGVNGTFPVVPFKFYGDEKGAGGGGGGGSLHILALGDIIIGKNGLIVCRGGTGGGGENTLYLNRVGGGSGAGSGGHVILETAGVIDMSLAQGPSTILGKLAGGIIATGGQGGAGAQDTGGAIAGANGKIESLPKLDACPPTLAGGTYPTTGTNSCRGHIDGAGGDGSPGLIQLHAPNGLSSILIPVGKTLADVCKPTPVFATGNTRMVPGFGQFSRARSIWVALGEGGFAKTTGTFRDVAFEFGGVDTSTGLVQTDPQGNVLMLGPVLPQATLVSPPGIPSILGERTIVLDATPLVGSGQEYLLESPRLLDRYLVELTLNQELERFDVVDASFEAATNALTLTVSDDGPTLTEKFGPNAAAALLPAYFRVMSSGLIDTLPDQATIQIGLQVAPADAFGNPDVANAVPAGGFTADPSVLNSAPGNNMFRFVRYDVLFDIDAQNAGLSPINPIPSLDFLRVPFRYN